MRHWHLKFVGGFGGCSRSTCIFASGYVHLQHPYSSSILIDACSIVGSSYTPKVWIWDFSANSTPVTYDDGISEGREAGASVVLSDGTFIMAGGVTALCVLIRGEMRMVSSLNRATSAEVLHWGALRQVPITTRITAARRMIGVATANDLSLFVGGRYAT